MINETAEVIPAAVVSMVNAGSGRLQAWELRQREEKKAQRMAYRDAYNTYLRARKKAVAANAEIVSVAQEQIKDGFSTYTLVINKQEGDEYVETDRVEVLFPEPDAAGYWQVITAGGKLEKWKYYCPVAISEERMRMSGKDELYSRQFPVPEAEMALCHSPALSTSAVKVLVETFQLRPLPTPPDPAKVGLGELANLKCYPDPERIDLSFLVAD